MSIEALKHALDLYELQQSDENHGNLMIAIRQAIAVDEVHRQIRLLRENINLMIGDFDNIVVGELVGYSRELEQLYVMIAKITKSRC